MTNLLFIRLFINVLNLVHSVNPTGWWMSEKLDGLRAYWDGKHFFSRLGNSFHAPEWFIRDLPQDMTLDGELFGGRGKFQSTVSIVKSGPSDRWKGIKFHVSTIVAYKVFLLEIPVTHTM